MCVSFLGANDWGWLGVLGVAGVGVGGGFSESAIGAAGVGALVAVAFFGGRCYFERLEIITKPLTELLSNSMWTYLAWLFFTLLCFRVSFGGR